MIGIRSVTYNAGNGINNSDELMKIQRMAPLCEKAFMPHTQRINLSEQYEVFPVELLKPVWKICDYSPVRWVNIPLNPKKGNVSELFSFALRLLKSSGRSFVNVIGVEDGYIYKDVFKNYASLIHSTGALSYTGEDGFRLGLSFNINHDCPFFPFTRATANQLSFTIALEMVEDINAALNESKARTFDQIREVIISELDPQIEVIYIKAKEIENKTGIRFGGFDFSIAPQISENGSVISILHNLGIFNFGHTGTMFATAFITDILKEFAGKYPSVGFSGVMYSLMEDLELCAINNDRGVTSEQLTSLATMCGCGLDMVPVNNDTTADEVSSLCYDIAGISCRYNKPLGVRLLSIPGSGRDKESYTIVSENADFIANTRVVQLDVNLLLKAEGNYKIKGVSQ